MYALLPTDHDSRLYFKLEEELNEHYGAIGYLRMDFGRSGREFWFSWFDIQPELKIPAFKHELDEVINALRDDGPEPPFASRGNLEALCATKPGARLGGLGLGYRVRTPDYSYYFRCLPRVGNYDIYVHVYDNSKLLPALSGNTQAAKKKAEPER
jgi:hypothetical protein